MSSMGGTMPCSSSPHRAQSWDATWLDAVAAQLLGETPVDVISAVRLAPRGRQKGLSAVRYPGGLLDPDHDPIIELVHLHAEAKAKGDLRNAASFGSCATAWSMATLPGSIPWAAGPKSPGHGASLLWPPSWRQDHGASWPWCRPRSVHRDGGCHSPTRYRWGPYRRSSRGWVHRAQRRVICTHPDLG